jgi:hypothetical protein
MPRHYVLGWTDVPYVRLRHRENRGASIPLLCACADGTFHLRNRFRLASMARKSDRQQADANWRRHIPCGLLEFK